jgi:hypothetical protein
MGEFFQSGPDCKVAVAKQFWVYWLVAIPVTLAVFGSWWIVDSKRTKSYKKALLEDGSIE